MFLYGYDDCHRAQIMLKRMAVAALALIAAFTSLAYAKTDLTAGLAVSLGQEFTLKKGETAHVQGLNVFLKVKEFINSPCPKGAQCVWSGLAVVYELRVDGKKYVSSPGNPPHASPYDVLVKGSDYKTYATFVIINACDSLEPSKAVRHEY